MTDYPRMNSRTPMPRSHQVAWLLMGVGYVVTIVVFLVLWFGRQDAPPAQQRDVLPTSPANPPAEQVDACRALLDYANEHGIPTGPNDPSYVEWKRLDEACEASK